MNRTSLFALLALACLPALHADPPMPGAGPLSPEEEMATFKVPEGNLVQLIQM